MTEPQAHNYRPGSIKQLFVKNFMECHNTRFDFLPTFNCPPEKKETVVAAISRVFAFPIDTAHRHPNQLFINPQDPAEVTAIVENTNGRPDLCYKWTTAIVALKDERITIDGRSLWNRIVCETLEILGNAGDRFLRQEQVEELLTMSPQQLLIFTIKHIHGSDASKKFVAGIPHEKSRRLLPKWIQLKMAKRDYVRLKSKLQVSRPRGSKQSQALLRKVLDLGEEILDTSVAFGALNSGQRSPTLLDNENFRYPTLAIDSLSKDPLAKDVEVLDRRFSALINNDFCASMKLNTRDKTSKKDLPRSEWGIEIDAENLSPSLSMVLFLLALRGEAGFMVLRGLDDDLKRDLAQAAAKSNRQMIWMP